MKRKVQSVLIKLIIISTISIFILIIYFTYFQVNKIPILTYHNIVNKKKIPFNSVNINKSKFEEQIKYLYNHNYKSLSIKEFYNWKVKNKKIPRKSVVLTFDDGWESFYTEAIPILEKYNMKASVFVIWKYIEICDTEKNCSYMNSKQINDIYQNHPNIDILSHSYNLHNKETADSNNYETYSNDIKKVNVFTKRKIEYYAYPYGHSNYNYIKALKDNNFKLAFTFGPYDFASKKNNNYKIPRIGVFESTNNIKLKLKLFLRI